MSPDIINKSYFSVRNEIKELNINKKEILLAFFISFFTISLIMVGFFAIISSLIIFTDLIAICIMLICDLAVIYFFLIDFMTIKLITRNRVLGLYHIYIVDLFYLFLVINAIGIIIMIGVL